jgi:protein-tyrosine phosphatase
MKLLFVCLGNICRSPMAEGVMKKLVAEHHLDWTVESAGTESYHIGEAPDRRAIRMCKEYGIDISSQCARKITAKDFESFDKIYALAEEVMDELERFHYKNRGIQPMLLMDELYPGQHISVPDPWYGTEKDFKIAFDLVEKACNAIIRKYAPKTKSVS